MVAVPGTMWWEGLDAQGPVVQIACNGRNDGSTTYALRVRVGGNDDRVRLGNSADGWDEARAERAREQLLAKIELGLWSPRSLGADAGYDEEPTFRELATDWFEAPIRDRSTGRPLRPISNSSINKTLLVLAAELDDAEDAGWVQRNVARGSARARAGRPSAPRRALARRVCVVARGGERARRRAPPHQDDPAG